MNIFFVLRHRGSDTVELVTAPLDRGDILPGVTRRSILELARGWGDQKSAVHSSGSSSTSSSSSGAPVVTRVSERWVPMAELVEAAEEGRLLEAFGAGKGAGLDNRYCSILINSHHRTNPRTIIDTHDTPSLLRYYTLTTLMTNHHPSHHSITTQSPSHPLTPPPPLPALPTVGTAAVVSPVRGIVYQGKEVVIPTGTYVSYMSPVP